MTAETAIFQLKQFKKRLHMDDTEEYEINTESIDMAIKALEQEPCEDAISRTDMLDAVGHGTTYTSEELQKIIKGMPPVNSQEPKTGQFAEWVATEIFDENWEYNKDAFAELACRKLTKLGIVRTNGDEWELIESQESEETDI